MAVNSADFFGPRDISRSLPAGVDGVVLDWTTYFCLSEYIFIYTVVLYT